VSDGYRPATTTPIGSQSSSYGAVMFAIGLGNNRTAAEVKIRVPRIAVRPAASLWSERKDLFSGGGTVRRFNEEGSRRRRFEAAVCPGGDKGGGLLDFGNRHRLCGQEAEHNANAAWDTAIAVLPTSDTSRTDAEQPSNPVLRDAECAKRRAELDRSY